MSGLISWLKGSGEPTDSNQNAEQNAASNTASSSSPAQQSTPPAAEHLSASEIRERRLRKLQQTTQAAAAAAAEAEAEAQKQQQQEADKKKATPASPASASSSAVAAVPAPAPASPARSTAVAASAPPSKSTPPASPLAKTPSKPAAPSSPAKTNLASPASAVTASLPGLPSIHPLPPSQYPSLHSPLPVSLLLGYHSGAGVNTERLIRAWENAAFGYILHVSVLDPSKSSGSSRQAGRLFLDNLAEELAQTEAEGEGKEGYVEPRLLLHRAHLDSVLMERLSKQSDSSTAASAASSGGGSTFSWLIASYRRAMEVENKLQSGLANATATAAHSNTIFPSSPADWQACIESVNVLLTCLVRYCGLLLSDEDMFQTAAQRASTRDEFLKLLCSDPAVSRTLPLGMLDHLVRTYQDDETFEAVFKPMADELAKPAKFQLTTSPLGESMPTMEDAMRQMQGLCQFLRFAPLAKLVVQHPNFLPALAPNGRMFMTISTLGSLLSVGASSTDPAFQNVINQRPQYEVEADVTRLRTSFSSYQQLCTQLFKTAIKHAPIRESILQWLSRFVSSNAARRRMQFHPFEVSSNNVFFNIMHVALQLCQPIIKKSAPADLEKVNLNYLLQTAGGRVDYDGHTRVESSLADVKQLRARLSQPLTFTPKEAPYSPFNFVTECFFLTHEVLCEGLGSIVRQYTELMQEVSRLSRQLQRMDPSALMYGQTQMQLNALFAHHLATRVHLQDPAFMSDVIAFYNWTSQWIRFHQQRFLKEREEEKAAAVTGANEEEKKENGAAASSSTAATSAVSVPSPSSSSAPPTQSSLIQSLPQPIVESMLETFIYLSRFQPLQLFQLPTNSLYHIIDLVLALAAGPFALKNPHLRANLAEFLLAFLPTDKQAHNDHLFNTHPLLVQNLIPTLLELYVSVEEGRGMYFLKFSARHQITILLEFLWQLPVHKAKLLEVAQATTDAGKSKEGGSPHASTGTPLFTQFINMLINDLIFLLDEGLKQLSEIRATQLEMEDEEKWRAQPEETLRERERGYAQSEQSASSCMTLANATVHLLHYLTAEVTEPFVTAEFVERIAHMLDYYLFMLVGPKIAELKVKDREKYQFRPRTLLQEIMGTWLNLAHHKNFLEKVATDERSYRPAVFAKAARILRKRGILSERQVSRFESLTEDLARLSEELLALEDILGDIPDEFADGLIGSLMSDPVELPQSHQVVDRTTIHRQLMNKKVDPFSNTPLTEEQLIERPDLKEQIQKWVEERKAAFREEQKKKEEEEAAAAGAAGDEEGDMLQEDSSSSSSSAISSPQPTRKVSREDVRAD